MKLNTRTWGEGERTAVLIHGIMADHRTWVKTAPVLAERGYRVIGVDLRGHGASGRGDYTIESFAQDLVETLPTGADLIIGHSLGGLVLSRAVETLRPARAVYSDPAWLSPEGLAMMDAADFAAAKDAPREAIVERNPRWDAEDIDIEMDTLRLWDPATAGMFAHVAPGTDLMPGKAVVPSLVVLADNSFLIDSARAARATESGFEVRTVPGAGHTIHRDDLNGFITALDGWI
jgi:pimeloyl-ACP methyl ester carboxylesterase